MKPYITGKDKNKSLHVEVWEAVHGPVPSGHIVHHIDEDKSNNTRLVRSGGNTTVLSCRYFEGTSLAPLEGSDPPTTGFRVR